MTRITAKMERTPMTQTPLAPATLIQILMSFERF